MTPETSAREPAASAEQPQGGLPVRQIAIGALALAAIFALARVGGQYVPVFAQWVEGLGVWGPVVFILGYALAVTAFVPGAVLTLAGGAIFGLAEGSVYVFIAAVIGSTLAFLVARYVARASIEQRVAGNPRFATIDEAVAAEGLKIVFLLRLSPVFPFNLLNYALGLTRVSLRDYALSSFGMLPGTIAYVYAGKVIGDVASVVGGAKVETGTAQYAVLALGLVATFAVSIIVARIARRALAQVTGEDASA